MPSLDAPDDRPYPFVYFITITNQSDRTVTVKGRKWIISQGNGEKIVVEGEGVVSQFPTLAPGDDFSYNSYHVVKEDSVAEGSFFAQGEDGSVFYTRIPEFPLRVPQWA